MNNYINVKEMFKTMKYIISIFFIFSTLCHAQLFIEDKQTELGEYDCLWINTIDDSIKMLDVMTINGYFVLSDHFLFYPVAFDTPSNMKIIDQNLININDSAYSFSISLSKVNEDPFSDILFYLCGYTLAGRDSLCYIDFSGMLLNGKTIDDFKGKIHINTENGTIPYYRMPELIIKGNPALQNEMKVAIYLWEDSDISFELYDMSGNNIKLIEYNDLRYGKTELTIDINQLSSGFYYLLMKTDNSTITERFVLIK